MRDNVKTKHILKNDVWDGGWDGGQVWGLDSLVLAHTRPADGHLFSSYHNAVHLIFQVQTVFFFFFDRNSWPQSQSWAVWMDLCRETVIEGDQWKNTPVYIRSKQWDWWFPLWVSAESNASDGKHLYISIQWQSGPQPHQCRKTVAFVLPEFLWLSSCEIIIIKRISMGFFWVTCFVSSSIKWTRVLLQLPSGAGIKKDMFSEPSVGSTGDSPNSHDVSIFGMICMHN